jgi:uncharacterized integral membrane protein
MTLPSEERPERELPPRPPAPLPAPGTATPPDTDPPALTTGELPAADDAPPAPPAPVPFTRIRAAWAGVWAGLVVVILLIIFVGQNTAPIRISFLWLDGLIPTALALLIAGVGGAIIALAAGAARIIQLRRMTRRNTR